MSRTNEGYVKKWEVVKYISICLNVIGLSLLVFDVFINNEPEFLEITYLVLLGVGVTLSFLSDFNIKRSK
ncbi:hypothetical protein GCM10008986_31650 [Salinibacillus aidingensis]|uniref:YrhK-like protein n=1 Tax=Salinibacillus aidingensis TaxID=237684 RepID=A0ABN1BPB7_9BACI